MSSTDKDQVYSDEDGDGNVDSEDFNNVQRHRERQFSDTTVSSNPDTSDSEPPFCDGGNEAGAGGDAPGGQSTGSSTNFVPLDLLDLLASFKQASLKRGKSIK